LGLDTSILSNLEGALAGVYAMAAVVLKAPYVELGDEQAKAYAKAISKLAAQYPDLQISPKAGAWIEFSTVVVGIHLPMILMATARKPRPVLVAKAESREPKSEQQVNGALKNGQTEARVVTQFDDPLRFVTGDAYDPEA
jgi:hypothetical protein